MKSEKECLLEMAEVFGWAFEKVSLYDEDGVEGWKTTSPRGHEWSEVGDWSEPVELSDECYATMCRDVASRLLDIASRKDGVG